MKRAYTENRQMVSYDYNKNEYTFHDLVTNIYDKAVGAATASSTVSHSDISYGPRSGASPAEVEKAVRDTVMPMIEAMKQDIIQQICDYIDMRTA